MKRWLKQCWRVAELQTAMQIATNRTPRWHRWLRWLELKWRRQ